MKPFLVALLLLMPFNLLAQNQPGRHSKAKKLEWVGIGALAGGIAGTVIGIATGKTTQEVFTYLQSGTCSTFQSSSSTASTCVTFVSGSTTLQVGTATGTITLSSQPRRTTNWKIAGPAIGAAGAGALMLELAHLQVKRAEFSIRPDGGVKVAFKW
jgi:hypothetical protein